MWISGHQMKVAFINHPIRRLSFSDGNKFASGSSFEHSSVHGISAYSFLTSRS